MSLNGITSLNLYQIFQLVAADDTIAPNPAEDVSFSISEQPQTTLQDHMYWGHHKYANHEFSLAIQHYKNALSHNIPDNNDRASIHKHIASAYIKLKDFKSAEKHYKEALNLPNLKFEFEKSLIFSLLEVKRFNVDFAYLKIEDCLALAELLAGSHIWDAVCLLLNGMSQAQPLDQDHYIKLGIKLSFLFTKTHRSDQAISFLNLLFLNKQVSLLQKKELCAAMEKIFIKKCLFYEGNGLSSVMIRSSYLDLANFYLSKGKFFSSLDDSFAISYCLMGLNFTGENIALCTEIYLQLGILYVHSDQFEEALECYRLILSHPGTDWEKKAEAFLFETKIYKKINQPQRAIVNYINFFNSIPFDNCILKIEVLIEISNAYRSLSDFTHAAEYLTHALIVANDQILDSHLHKETINQIHGLLKETEIEMVVAKLQ